MPPPAQSSNDTDNDKMRLALEYALYLVGGLGVLIFIATIFRATILADAGSDGAGTLGTSSFGDAFGFATSLFTGAAFVGLLIAMRMQRRELHLTQQALRGQEALNADILSNAKIQRLEDRFFTLLPTVRQLSREVSVGGAYIWDIEGALKLVSESDTPAEAGQSLVLFMDEHPEIEENLLQSGVAEFRIAITTIQQIADIQREEAVRTNITRSSDVLGLQDALESAVHSETAKLYAFEHLSQSVFDGFVQWDLFEALQHTLHNQDYGTFENAYLKALQRLDSFTQHPHPQPSPE